MRSKLRCVSMQAVRRYARIVDAVRAPTSRTPPSPIVGSRRMILQSSVYKCPRVAPVHVNTCLLHRAQIRRVARGSVVRPWRNKARSGDRDHGIAAKDGGAPDSRLPAHRRAVAEEVGASFRGARRRERAALGMVSVCLAGAGDRARRAPLRSALRGAPRCDRKTDRAPMRTLSPLPPHPSNHQTQGMTRTATTRTSSCRPATAQRRCLPRPRAPPRTSA